VALVEAVAGEVLHLFPDLRRDVARAAVLLGAVDELVPVLRHLLELLLAHRLAQRVGLVEVEAGQDVGDAHHLLLVHHDPVGLAQDRLEALVGVAHRLDAALAVHVGVDHPRPERARPVEREDRDDVLEDVGPHLREQLLHPARFQLEDGARVAALQQLEGLLVVERNLVVDELAPVVPDEPAAWSSDRQRLQPEKSIFTGRAPRGRSS
jgi:hypothetical protein